MKSFKQRFSLLLVFFFLFTFIPRIYFQVNADELELPLADTPVIIAGNFIDDVGLGGEWAADNTQALMKQYKDGIYELEINFNSPITDGEYKITLDKGWDRAFPSSNKTINVSVPQKVIFRFNSKTNEVYDSINDPAQFKTFATLVGTIGQTGGTDWKPDDSDYDLNYIGGGFYKKSFTLNAGSYEYKVAYNHGWSNGEVGSNVSFTITEDKVVTFLANPLLGICTDSIANPSIDGNISLIGPIRGGYDWTADKRGFEFQHLTSDGKFVYSGFFPAGSYTYKGIENYNWDSGGVPRSGDKTITIPEGGKYVIFIADRANLTMIDSINNPSDVAALMGLKPRSVSVKSPVINPDGTVTFSYKNDDATSVSLRGAMNSWGETPMVKDNKTGVWSITLRLGDEAQNYEYKFFVNNNNWITDPVNSKESNGNSLLEFPTYAGRRVVLAGTIQAAAGESNWTPGSEKTKLSYDGNGRYSITIKDVPAGQYEYKIAMGSWDPENYGANGKSYGDNMKVNVPVKQDVTFWYSDDSHYTVNSVEYTNYDISLRGTGIPQGTKLTDPLLKNLFTSKVNLSAGTYEDIKAIVDGKEYSFGSIILSEAKDVTFSYAPSVNMVFNDASSKAISLKDLYFNSRESSYKQPYGAVPTDKEITISLKAKKDDLTVAKLVLLTSKGTIMVDMNKNGYFEDGSDKWTAKYTFNEIGMNKYYFIVSNGSDLKAYGDDDGFFGTGKAGEIGNIGLYDMNIYDKNFKTPDWMKNAIIYQIFPDRFFNGDKTNDRAQEFARGNVPYEFYEDWYAIPEDPQIEFLRDKDGKLVLGEDGKPVVDPDYLALNGTVGDGNWSNEMYGGDIKGVQDKLDYLQSLGVNVLYFNPISASISNHRYDATDYNELDPLLGHMEDFVKLAKEVEKRNMHLILDGVFNHVSDDSIYFDRYAKYVKAGEPIGAYQYWKSVYDLMNTGVLSLTEAESSVQNTLKSMGINDFHYKDWFKIDNIKVDEGLETEHYQYEGWWGYDSMPVIQSLNGSEYNVKTWADEIISGENSTTRFWLNQGSNGWRLDVANEVSDETWRYFRQAVKEEGDNVIVGEIWDDASRYILGDMYDSVMNYRFRNAVLAFVQEKDAAKAMNILEQMREQYPREAFEAMMNLVGSHDTQRIISALDGYQKSVKDIAKEPTAEAKELMKLVSMFQMTYPGAPTIYYGDEAGMAGADDPDNRRAMIWGKEDKELVAWYSKLGKIRNSNEVLRTGDISVVEVPSELNKEVMAFTRYNANDYAVVAMNRGNAAAQLEVQVNLKDGTLLVDAITGSEYSVEKGKVKINIPSKLGVILITKSIDNGENGGNGDDGNSKNNGQNGDSDSNNTPVNNPHDLPKTGSPIDASIIAGLGIIVLALGSIIVIRNRKRSK